MICATQIGQKIKNGSFRYAQSQWKEPNIMIGFLAWTLSFFFMFCIPAYMVCWHWNETESYFFIVFILEFPIILETCTDKFMLLLIAYILVTLILMEEPESYYLLMVRAFGPHTVPNNTYIQCLKPTSIYFPTSAVANSDYIFRFYAPKYIRIHIGYGFRSLFLMEQQKRQKNVS